MGTVMDMPSMLLLISLIELLILSEIASIYLDEINSSHGLSHLSEYRESYFTPSHGSLKLQEDLRESSPGNSSREDFKRAPGPNAAASNGGGIIRWENITQRF